MTREEAIFCEGTYLGENNCVNCKYYATDTCESRESHKMAIEALRANPCEVTWVTNNKGEGVAFKDMPIEKVNKILAIMDDKPCEDAVSRQAVLEITAETGALETQARVKALPPVIPKQRTGKWNDYYTSQKGNDIFNCKLCGATFIITQGKDDMNFCPNCGAKMEGVSE